MSKEVNMGLIGVIITFLLGMIGHGVYWSGHEYLWLPKLILFLLILQAAFSMFYHKNIPVPQYPGFGKSGNQRPILAVFLMSLFGVGGMGALVFLR